MKLISPVNFNAQVDENGNLELAGKILKPADQRVLIRLNDADAADDLTGVTWSSNGFWYFYLQPDPSGSFSHTVKWPSKAGQHISCTVQKWGGAGTVSLRMPILEEFSTPKDIKVFIYGSCVSRDCFSREGAPQLTQYFARSSLLSSMSKDRSGLEEADLSQNSSAFQRRIVDADLNRKLASILPDKDADLILVDFIDERFRLGRQDGGGFFTLSTDLVSCKLDLSEFEVIEGDGDWYFEAFEKSWIRFVDLVGSTPILLNNALWATHDSEGNLLSEQMKIRKNNEKLQRLYKIAKTVAPQVDLVNPGSECLVADPVHKWGISPFHYVSRFEENLIESIFRTATGKAV